MTYPKRLTLYSAAFVIALVAWVLNVTYLYWMAGTLVLLELASRLVARLEQRGLVVVRELPAAGNQGETVPVKLHLTNQTWLPKLHLSVADELPPGLTPTDAEPLPVHLPPKGEDHAEYALRLGRRGWHELPALRVQSTDTLGLSLQETRHAVSSHILVYPRILDLPPAALPPEMGGGQAPVESAGRQGEGASFFGIREYRRGDPLRHVHWRTVARTGQLAVVEWEAEESREALIAVETGAGTERKLGDSTTLDLAAGIAASLANYVLAAGHSLRVLAPGALEWSPAAERGLGALPRLLEGLARMQAVSPVSVAAEFRQTAPYLTRGTLVCYLTPVADETTLETVRYLLAAHLRPVLYALEDTPARAKSPWDGIAAELERMAVPVVRLRRDNELVQRLLS